MTGFSHAAPTPPSDAAPRTRSHAQFRAGQRGRRPDLVIAAPGAGLGHLTRASVLATGLRAAGVSTRIVTYSQFGPALARVTGHEIFTISTHHWTTRVAEVVAGWRPALVLLDVFPLGIRGEWRNTRLPTALLARRLDVGEYLHAAGLDGPSIEAGLGRVLVCEPLNAPWHDLVRDRAAEVVVLPGPLRSVPATDGRREGQPSPRTPVVEASARAGAFSAHGDGGAARPGPATLVVHSGPIAEMTLLCRRALDEVRQRGLSPNIVLIGRPDVASAVCGHLHHVAETAGIRLGTRDCYPANALFGQAELVVTAAGYNSMADGVPLGRRHVAVPLTRRYDDQPGRLAAATISPAFWLNLQATSTAVGTLVSWLNDTQRHR